MSTSQMLEPSVLLLDDGELDGVHRQLERIGADVVRLQGRWVSPSVPRPRDLLVTSMRRTRDMPGFEGAAAGAAAPTWVCVHSQDFLPLRMRLRDLGVHFLVQSGLDAGCLREFLLQLLHTGHERRARFRLPLGITVNVLEGGGGKNRKPARLAELSADACRILSASPIGEPGSGDPVHIVLPWGISGGESFELSGPVVRTTPCQSPTGERVHSTVVAFRDLEPETRAALQRIVAGDQIGTRVSPLAERSQHVGASVFEELSPDESARSLVETFEERRCDPRHLYDRRVALLDLCDMQSDGSALGLDLSLTGIRMLGGPSLPPATCVTLALSGGHREEPVLVPAEVVRTAAGGDPDALAFRFVRLSDSQRKALEKLLRGLPPLAALPDGGPVVLAKIVRER